MKKATLYCPEESVFFNNLLVRRPSIPSDEGVSKNNRQVEVNILEVLGEKALVLLPNFVASGEQQTAMVNLQYLI